MITSNKEAFPDECCQNEECVLDDPTKTEGNGKCQCITGYTYNSTKQACQKIPNFGEDCDGVCVSGLICYDNKKCSCPTGQKRVDNECKTDTGADTDSGVNSSNSSNDSINSVNVEDDSSYSQIINFKIMFLIAYLSIFIFI